MTLPTGVTTCAVKVGTAVTMFGEAANIKVTVTPIYGGTAKRIVWEATGQSVPDFPQTFTSSNDNTEVEFAVPHVDQAGFLDPSGNPITMWAYAVKVTITDTNRQSVSYTQTVQPLVGQAVIDLDLIPDGTSAVPVEVAPTYVTTAQLNDALAALDGGDTEGFAFVNHGTDANAVRPDAVTVVWAGSVEPVNADVDYDLWVGPDEVTTTADTILGHDFWTAPLAADEPTVEYPSSGLNLVERLTYQATMTTSSTPVTGTYAAPYNTATNGGSATTSTSAFALPWYRMPADTPRVPVWHVGQPVGSFKPNLQPVLDAGVPLPNPALLPDGTIPPSGSDGSVIITQGDELWELWKVMPRAEGLSLGYTIPDGYDWICRQGGHMANRNAHPGIWAAGAGGGGRVAGWSWGVGASGHAKSGGLLTAHDYYADVIAHPLELALPLTGGSQATDPVEPSSLLSATRYDRLTFVPGGTGAQPLAENYRIPEGAHFRLPTTFDIDSYIADLPVVAAGANGANPETLRKVLIAIRDYGLLVVDSSGVVTFSAEHPKTYGTPYNPYSAAQIPTWGNFGQQIPWASLVQLAPPTTDISVPGSA